MLEMSKIKHENVTCNDYISTKMRIGASDLAAHSQHRKKLSHPGCKFCGNQLESIQHFLLECPHHAAHRHRFLSAVTPHLRKLEVESNTATLLGILPFLSSPKMEKKTRRLRKCILQNTLMFLSETERFEE